jgi:hypothetical protein
MCVLPSICGSISRSVCTLLNRLPCAEPVLQLPTILFATLCYAIWLSFFGIGSQNISPTTWPIIWIGFAVAMLVNPLPVFSRSSRYWLLKNVLRLLVSGTSRVEFTDFWMGDQFCSLVFTLGHIYTVGCAYSHKWHNVWGHCNTAMHWPVPFLLVALPSFVRLVQSIRRWHDSKLPTHLINVRMFLSTEWLHPDLFFCS